MMAEKNVLTFQQESFQDEVFDFIERRLKYKYRRKLIDDKTGTMKRMPYRLASNAFNCGV